MEPYRRPHGELQYIHGRIQQVVQEGFPEVGWEGDPLLTVYYNAKDEEWQVLDHAFSPPQTILRKASRGLGDLDYRTLCQKLKAAQFKGQGVQSIINRMEARNEAVEAERTAISREYNMEAAEKLAWAVGKAVD